MKTYGQAAESLSGDLFRQLPYWATDDDGTYRLVAGRVSSMVGGGCAVVRGGWQL